MSEELLHWLEKHPAPWFIGEVVILPSYELRNAQEIHALAEELLTVPDFAALRELVKYDSHERFRPVRGFSGLKSGWRWMVSDIRELVLALNWIYPVALALYFADRRGELIPTEFQETADRQTGMYSGIRLLTGEQRHQLIGENCRAHCLRSRLWSRRSLINVEPSRLPLLCPEACNYLIDKARSLLNK